MSHHLEGQEWWDEQKETPEGNRWIYITDLIINYQHGDDDDRRENSLFVWIDSVG